MDEAMKAATVQGIRLDEQTELWTWQQPDGWYECVAVSNDNGFFETDDNGPFETREAAIEAGRNGYLDA